MSWSTANSDPVCGPVSYNLSLSSSGVLIRSVITTDTVYNFSGLAPNTTYNVAIAGVNLAGVGEFTEEMIFTPSIGIPIGKPECVFMYLYMD